jgi:hypothetical protein
MESRDQGDLAWDARPTRLFDGSILDPRFTCQFTNLDVFLAFPDIGVQFPQVAGWFFARCDGQPRGPLPVRS